MIRLLRWLTVVQWKAIDDEYRTEPLPNAKVYWILVFAALALIAPRYFGRPESILEIDAAKRLFSTWPHPDLYPRLYWAGFKLINYGVIPAICIKLVLRERIVDHGLSFHKSGKTWLLYFAMLALVVPMAYAVSFSPAFLATYPKYAAAGRSWTQFLLWEAGYGFQFFMLEFFFRGFLLFALARYLGPVAIFIAIVPYAMIHFGKPLAETLGSVLAGIALGTIALRTRSIYGGVLVHCGVAWSMDLFALMRKGELGRLFG